MVAVANLCVSKKCKTIEETIRHAYAWLRENGYETRIHVFGPAVNCVRKVADLIYAWDSTAWTRPRQPGGWSAKNNGERTYLFLTWLHRYSNIIDLPAHPKTMKPASAEAEG
jgi:hypothetical protein